ncbi:hypothetical protein WJX74_004240 [Apatococcus lobatus]|uniref:Mitochondrial carrier protein n=1 Tax=Apatococcus lobatus TaxID=904363 RepID=A0AAW1QXW4_9CHLO
MQTVKLLLAGGLAGAISKTATAPLARLTILYQVSGLHLASAGAGAGHIQRLSLGAALQHIIHQEGFRALWKGNGVTIIHRMPYSAANFWAYESITRAWQHKWPASRPHEDILRRLCAGGLAGMTACSLAYPLDLVRTRLSAQTTSNYYTGISHALRAIVQDEGFLGLYRGLGATLLQIGPSLALNYCAYETLRSHALQLFPEYNSPTVAMSLACGSMAGVFSSSFTFPLDLVRRRIQLCGQHGGEQQRMRYKDVVRSIMAHDGFRGFYAGLLPEYYKVVPSVALAFCSYETLKKFLNVATVDNRHR